MLLGLKQLLKAGDSVPITLVIESRDKKRENVEVNAKVHAPNMPAASEHKH